MRVVWLQGSSQVLVDDEALALRVPHFSISDVSPQLSERGIHARRWNRRIPAGSDTWMFETDALTDCEVEALLNEQLFPEVFDLTTVGKTFRVGNVSLTKKRKGKDTFFVLVNNRARFSLINGKWDRDVNSAGHHEPTGG